MPYENATASPIGNNPWLKEIVFTSSFAVLQHQSPTAGHLAALRRDQGSCRPIGRAMDVSSKQPCNKRKQRDTAGGMRKGCGSKER